MYITYKFGGIILKPHFIQSDNMNVIFFPDTFKFYEINSITKNMIKDIINNVEKEKILSKYRIDNKVYDKVKNTLDNNVYKQTMCSKSANENVLRKLVINITNVCNLSCKYCYAHGGSYNSSENMISKENIIKTLDVFYSQYDSIENIQIFGGEPTLNLDGIEIIAEYVENRFVKHKDNKKTKLGMVSNGTVVNQRLIGLINKYNINITISLDGPAIVNDKMRIFRDGSGTEKCISENIKLLREETGQPSLIEATYHRGHEESKIKIKDIISYGKNKFGINNFHIMPVSGSEEDFYSLLDRSEFVNSISDLIGINNNCNLPVHDMIKHVINTLTNKKICKYLCEAGLSVLSVSTKGNVYPCFMLIDQEEYNMGNINDDNLFNSQRFLKIKNELSKFSKFEYYKCKDCFNNTICHGCIGSNYFETGNIYEQSDDNCNMYKQITEKVIIELIKNGNMHNS